MNLMKASRLCKQHFYSSSNVRRSSGFYTRSSILPFSSEKVKYHKELEAAVDVVQRACRLCVEVKQSMLSSNERVIEKNDQTPVTVADFGVQALISLELNRSFPSIPLVAEEDSTFIRSQSVYSEQNGGYTGNSLADVVWKAVTDKVTEGCKTLAKDDLLEAIDRGSNKKCQFGNEPATYWVLDPIDGTRGFIKGGDALYVVGLALIVDGEIALGVMGCPNWNNTWPVEQAKMFASARGIIMISHTGCGTWAKRMSNMADNATKLLAVWTRCFVDGSCTIHDAQFCIGDSQNWESFPLSTFLDSSLDGQNKGEEQKINLLPTCCGSLCKYLMVASGRASAFILHSKLLTGIKAWDHAVGVICVTEAGGKVSDFKGNSLDLAEDPTRRAIFPSGGVLVTNGILHKEIIDIISSNPSLI